LYVDGARVRAISTDQLSADAMGETEVGLC